MNDQDLEKLLAGVQSGAISADDAVAQLRRLPFADLGFARVDHHRHLRQGRPEAIYAPGKTAAQCVAIVAELLEHSSGPVLLTRADRVQREAVLAAHPAAHVAPEAPAEGRLATIFWRAAPLRSARVLVVTAGTADLAVADECLATLRAYGFAPELLADCGVAGVHRLLAAYDELVEANALVVIAGMEGALASVVGGLSAAPVVAVPTSVGYGAALEGVTALLAMHASCAAGITVVGIDNGYGAACAIARILA
jgi:hypothetical protein